MPFKPEAYAEASWKLGPHVSTWWDGYVSYIKHIDLECTIVLKTYAFRTRQNLKIYHFFLLFTVAPSGVLCGSITWQHAAPCRTHTRHASMPQSVRYVWCEHMRAMRLRPGPGKQVIKTKVWLRVVFASLCNFKIFKSSNSITPFYHSITPFYHSITPFYHSITPFYHSISLWSPAAMPGWASWRWRLADPSCPFRSPPPAVQFVWSLLTSDQLRVESLLNF